MKKIIIIGVSSILGLVIGYNVGWSVSGALNWGIFGDSQSYGLLGSIFEPIAFLITACIAITFFKVAYHMCYKEGDTSGFWVKNSLYAFTVHITICTLSTIIGTFYLWWWPQNIELDVMLLTKIFWFTNALLGLLAYFFASYLFIDSKSAIKNLLSLSSVVIIGLVISLLCGVSEGSSRPDHSAYPITYQYIVPLFGLLSFIPNMENQTWIVYVACFFPTLFMWLGLEWRRRRTMAS
jgi:hypothetical protein